MKVRVIGVVMEHYHDATGETLHQGPKKIQVLSPLHLSTSSSHLLRPNSELCLSPESLNLCSIWLLLPFLFAILSFLWFQWIDEYACELVKGKRVLIVDEIDDSRETLAYIFPSISYSPPLSSVSLPRLHESLHFQTYVFILSPQAIIV